MIDAGATIDGSGNLVLDSIDDDILAQIEADKLALEEEIRQ